MCRPVAGYGGELTPNPDCIVLNLMVTLQTVVSLLLDYSILGLVYARFSSPTLRAGSIRFSKSLLMTLEGGHLVLSTRISNVRRQNVLSPSVRMLLALEMDDADDESCEEHGFPLRLVVRCASVCGLVHVAKMTLLGHRHRPVAFSPGPDM